MRCSDRPSAASPTPTPCTDSSAKSTRAIHCPRHQLWRKSSTSAEPSSSLASTASRSSAARHSPTTSASVWSDSAISSQNKCRPDSVYNVQWLPELRSILATDIEAAYNGDPAADSYGEIICCYPVVKAITCYRIAHKLLQLGVPLIPRIITEMAHSETGIDIHPGAQIGHHFTIDHGTGVVIGATCIIGNNVKLYQGVTLGARSFALDENGNPIKGIARHPILEDDVIVYSNATVLGRITLARGTVIGGNVWVTESTKPGEQVIQAKKRKSQVVRPEDWGCL